MWCVVSGVWAAVCAALQGSALVGAALAPAAALAAAAAAVTRRPRSSRPFAPARCIAHRAAALDAPQNTMPALKYCIENGCKNVEFDIRMTRDGKCVLFHDAVLGSKRIADTEWSELKDIHLESNHPMSQRFGPTDFCLFEDAVDFLVANKASMIIDVKDADKRIYTSIINMFKRYPELYDTTIVTSFNPFVIYKLRYMDSSIIGALNYRPRCFSSLSCSVFGASLKRFPNNRIFDFGARVLDMVYSCVWSSRILPFWTGSTAVILHKDIASPYIVERWKEAKYSVLLYGVNQPLDKYYAMKTLGVPYITDTLVGEPSVHREINGTLSALGHTS